MNPPMQKEAQDTLAAMEGNLAETPTCTCGSEYCTVCRSQVLEPVVVEQSRVYEPVEKRHELLVQKTLDGLEKKEVAWEDEVRTLPIGQRVRVYKDLRSCEKKEVSVTGNITVQNIIALFANAEVVE